MIVLDTHSFQAPDLYPALGYEKVGETTDTPVGHSQLMFQKRLPDPGAASLARDAHHRRADGGGTVRLQCARC